MKAFLLAIATTGCLFAGQVHISTDAAPVPGALTPSLKKDPAAGAPLLGYVTVGGPADLYAIVGSAARPQFGDPVQTPDGTIRVYLPPSQQYSLIEKDGDSPVEVWNFKQRAVPVDGAPAHPEMVAFSPRGEAAVLFSRSELRFQIVIGLPAEPRIAEVLSAPSGDLVNLAVSDDGLLLAAQFSDRTPLYSFRGEPWKMIATTARPQAWSFVPRTYDLVMSDAEHSQIALLSNIHTPQAPERVLATNSTADHLALNKQGDELMAQSAKNGTVLDISLRSGKVSSFYLTGPLTVLSVLRSGSNFLLSISPNVVVKSSAPTGFGY